MKNNSKSKYAWLLSALTALAVFALIAGLQACRGGTVFDNPLDPKGNYIHVTAVSLDSSSLVVAIDGTAQLSATVAPADALNKSLSWSSSEPTVAAVSETGLVTGEGLGTATITASSVDGGKAASCVITVVTPVLVTGVSFDKTESLLLLGETDQLTATIAPEDATDRKMTWASDKPTIATVSSGGLVSAVSVGTATITVTTVDQSKAATCAITVVASIPVTEVSLDKTEATIGTGATEQLTATILPARATDKGLAWTTSNKDVATVSSTGLVSAVAIGTATVTVTTSDGGKTASCVITVIPAVPVVAVSLNKSSVTVKKNATEQLTATIAPSGATNKAMAWKSDKESVATVSSTGLITGIAVGTAIITVTTADGAKTSSCEVTVPYNYVTGVSLNKTTDTIIIGSTDQLTATVAPSDAMDKEVSWTTSDITVATVSASGLVSAIAVGTATITVTTTEGAFKATCAVTVSPVAVTDVTLNKTTNSLLVGATDQLTATIAPTNATIKGINWTSSNEAVATVTAAGLVKAEAAGTATITATTVSGSKAATCAVTVIQPVPVTSVSLNKTTDILVKGGMHQLVATIAPANATTKTITWTSNDSAVATVSASGIVTGIGAGLATVTATTVDGGKVASCEVTVSLSVATDVYFIEDFESGLGNWTVSGSDWAIIDTTFRSTSHSATDSPGGNYSANANTSMVLSKKIDLTTAIAPVLSYWYKIGLNYNADYFGVSSKDYCYTELSQDGGLTWIALKSYSVVIISSWTNETIDLSPYVGKSVKIRFHLVDNASSGTADGWTLDDIEIKENDTERIAYPFFENFENGTVNWQLKEGDDWKTTTTTSRSATHAITESPDGNYLPSVNSQLVILHPVDLSSAIAPALSYWYKIGLNWNADYFGVSSQDYCYTELSQDGGLTWIALKSYSCVNISTWTNEILDLSAYKGKAILIRFRLCDNSKSPAADGWTIDDISIAEL